MPGMGLVMDGAVQQAPQDGRHARVADGGIGFIRKAGEGPIV